MESAQVELLLAMPWLCFSYALQKFREHTCAFTLYLSCVYLQLSNQAFSMELVSRFFI